MASNSGRRSSSSASLREAASSPYEQVHIEARPSTTGRGGHRSILGGSDPRRASYNRRVRILLLTVTTVVLALVAYLVVTRSPLFAIKSVVSTPTTHITQEAITQLAAIPEGSTLYNVDERAIESRIKENTWVKSVSITRTLPNQLNIAVQERTEAAIVMLANGTEAWRLSDDGYWVEAVVMQSGTDAATPSSQAAAAAEADGVVMVTDVAASVAPSGGSACADNAILGVLTYLTDLPAALTEQIASFKAPSVAGISAILTNGVEVALGNPANQANWKGEVALKILEENAGLATYVNVRTPDSATWRATSAEGTQAASITDAETGDQQGTDTSTEGEDVDGEGQEGENQEGEDQPEEEVPVEEEVQDTDIATMVATYQTEVGEGYTDEGGHYIGTYISEYGTELTTYYNAAGEYVAAYTDADGNWVEVGF